MSTRLITIALPVALLTAALGSGCSSSELPATSSAAAEKPSETPAAPAEQPTAKPATAAEAKKAKAKQSAYKPPFPERSDFFSPPERSEGLVAVSVDGRESTVELMGFVNVGTPHVVLAINGVFTPISQGVEHNGVEVISIQPPRAVLQRGRTRWTAKLQ